MPNYPFDLGNYVREFRMKYTQELNDHFKDFQLGGMVIFGRVFPDRMVIQFCVNGEQIEVETPPVQPAEEMLIAAVLAMRKRLALDEDDSEDEGT